MWQFLRRIYRTYLSEQESGFFLALLLGIAVVFYYIGSYLLPFFISIFTAFMLNELVIKLKGRKVPHLTAVLLIFILFLGTAIIALVFLLPFLWSRLSIFINAIPSILEDLQRWLELLPQKYPDYIREEDIPAFIDQLRQQSTEYGQAILSSSLNSLNQIISFVIYCLLVMVMVFFILKDYSQLGNYLARFLPQERKLLNQLARRMKREILRYVVGKGIEMIIVAGASLIVFLILGLDFSFILALTVGVSVIIPYIGAALATIPVAIVAFAQFGTDNMFYYILLSYLILQFLDGNVLVPYLFSEIVNIHPVSTILAILIFGSLWGFWGVFLAIPLATFIKALVRFWPRTPD